MGLVFLAVTVVMDIIGLIYYVSAAFSSAQDVQVESLFISFLFTTYCKGLLKSCIWLFF
jgi:hypothetical protein